MSQKYQIEPLDVDNYAIWSKKMKSVLIEKDLWDGAFVGKKLSDTSATTIDDKASHKALALITLNVADHHVTEIGDCTTAKEAWDLLEGVYKAKSGAKRLLLRKQLNDLKKRFGGVSECLLLASKAVAEGADSCWVNCGPNGRGAASAEWPTSIVCHQGIHH
jgi:gag-polypeptide of LTR copia-type/Domain of unknown function (DUF4219)